MKRIHIFGYVRIRARWIGPYAWRIVRHAFRGCMLSVLQNIRHAFAIRSECIHVMFATCSLSVCYIFAMEKYGFCATKVWFLACKNPLFTLQKGSFWHAKRWFLFFAIMVDAFADAGKRFYFAGVVGCVIVTSMQLFWFSRLRRVVRMSSQVIFSTM